MKKYFYSVLAASMLFACSQEEIVDVTKGEGQLMTFKVEIPEIGQSRTVNGTELGDGSKANKLIYAMYEENTNAVLVNGCVDKKSERTFEVTVPMAKDIKYDLLFFAYNEDNCAFQINQVAKTTNLKALKFKANQIHNEDAFDAFVGKALTQEVGKEHKVTLTRPFAQLNAATTKQDLEDAKTLMSTIASSKITVSGIHDTYNVFDGATSLSEGSTNFQVTYGSTETSPKMLVCNNPNDKYKDDTNITNEPIVVNGTTYYYLNMAYVLPGSTTASVKYEFYRNDGKLVSELDIKNVPLQANHRTNIVGNLLTKSEDYTMTIVKEFNKGYAYASEAIVNKEGVTYSGEFFENPITDALYFNNWLLEGDATIKVENKTYEAIILENVKGNLKGNVIEINNENNSVMVLQNCDFTLAEGKKLIKSENTIYQVFMTNITINGVKLTQESAAQYLENVGWYQVVEEI